MHKILQLSKYTVRNTAFHIDTFMYCSKKLTWNGNSKLQFNTVNCINDQEVMQFSKQLHTCLPSLSVYIYKLTDMLLT